MNENNRNTDYGDVHNHISVHASGHQIGRSHNGVDVALAMIGAMLAIVAIVAIFVFGLVALPFVAVVAVIYVVAQVFNA
ncbi:MAG: hypothetical protein U0350_49280 [Caldilineaceae bacterium]